MHHAPLPADPPPPPRPHTWCCVLARRRGALQVAERSLFLWNNEYIVNLVAQHRHQLLPILFPALEENTNSHWNPAVHGLTCNVRKMFQELDEQLYDECKRKYEEEQAQQRQLVETRDQKWQYLQNLALQGKNGGR